MELSDKYRIVYDSENVILQFHEMREKQILVKDITEKTGKYVGTGEFKEFTENYYFPSLETALKGFLVKSTWGLETAELVLSELDKVNKVITAFAVLKEINRQQETIKSINK